MASYQILKLAGYRLDDIYQYTVRNHGKPQAVKYINEMFERFQAIADRNVIWNPIPAEFGVSGYYTKYEKHFIYWKELSSGKVGIVTILHQRMDKANRLKREINYPQ